MDSPNGFVRELDPDGTAAGVLVHSLTGFLDAGSAGRIAVEHLLEVLPSRVVAEFDIDSIYDYRARRPRMTFLTDHYGEIDMPALRVHEVRDSSDQPFLLLHGPEPDFRWRAFADDVAWLAVVLGVELVVGLHAVPWPAPHTRPVNVTTHANDRDLVGDRAAFVGDLEVPAHVAGLLELTMAEHDVPAMGFAAHVPHYLSGAQYPRASVALLEALSAQTGLLLPLAALREQASATDEEIGLQVAADAENVEAVVMLERQYDEFMARARHLEDDVADISQLDAADFVDQVERFLADRDLDDRD